jgi:hypothetical protein
LDHLLPLVLVIDPPHLPLNHQLSVPANAMDTNRLDATAKAGKSFEIPSVDLKKWFKFDETGYYKVRGSYYMRFGLPKKR